MQNHRGFTLIELIMTIIILGILAATVLPKFVDLSQKARLSALLAGRGAIKSAMTIVYSKAVIEGKERLASSSINLENETIDIAYGYPIYGNSRNSPIITAAGLDTAVYHANMTVNGRTLITLSINETTTSSACAIQYSNATETAPPIVGSVSRSGFMSLYACRAR